MALVVKDRVKETTTSTGTGTVTLAGATQGYQSFSVVGDGNTTYYTITNGTDWEVGIGTYTATGTTLSRDTILESSNSGSAVNFSAGVKDVFVTYPAEKAVTLDGTETLTNKTINGSNNTITNVSLTTGITGTLAVANGGTGATSLTSGYVLKGNGTSPVTSSVIYDNGTNVGIGTSSPSRPLHVVGGANITNAVYSTFFAGFADTDTYFVIDGTNVIRGVTGGIERMRIDSSGNVGIGTSSPDAKTNIVVSSTGRAWSPTAGFSDLVVERNANAGFTVVASNTANSYVNFADTDDENAGMIVYQHSDNAMTFRTNGSGEDMRIDNSGNVGIGTTSPGAKLHVSDAANGKILISGTSTSAELELSAPIPKITFTDTSGSAADGEIKVDGNAMQIAMNGSEAMRIDSAGNVGIGTSSPSRSLSVYDTTVPVIALQNSTTGQTTGDGFQIYALGSTAYLDHKENGSLNFLTNSAERMRIDSSGNLLVGTTTGGNRFRVSGDMFIQAASTGQNTQTIRALSGQTGNLLQWQNSGGTGLGVIDSSGRVGIGTSSPGAKLDVNGTSNFGGAINLLSGSQAYFYNPAGNAFSYINMDASNNVQVFNNAGAAIAFSTSATERMRITSAGLVGIGTSSPAQLLHVQSTSGAAGSAVARLAVSGTAALEAGQEFFSTPTDSTTSLRSGRIYSKFDGISYTDARLSFQSMTSGNTLVDTMHLKGGNVGIGTSSPAQLLEVRNLSGDARVGIRSIDTGIAALMLGDDSNGSASYVSYNNAVNALSFATTSNERMRIDSSGNVGIGTTSPAAKLHLSDTGPCELIIEADTDNVTETDNSRIIFKQDGGAVVGRVGYANGSNSLEIINQYAENLYLGTSNSVDLTINSAGNITAAVDFRAPIFYDSGDTGYYVNPNGTSVLWEGQVKGNRFSFELGTEGVGSTNRLLSFEGNYTNGQYTHRFRKEDVSGGVPLSLDYSQATAGSYTELIQWGPFTGDAGYRIRHNDSTLISGILNATSDVRAPIFYDSDNTAYYANPAGSSVFSDISAGGAVYASNWFRSYGTTGWYSQTYGGGIYMTDGTWVRVYNNKQFYSENYIQSGSSVRAPIFYDSNDTGYYVDPASTSNLNDVQAENLPYAKAGSAYGTENTFTTDGGVGANNITRSMFYRDNNGQFGALGVHVAHATNNNYALQIASTSYSNNTGTFQFRLKDNGTWTSATTLIDSGSANQTKSGYFQSNNSLRAPIFYDSNNTAYYTDPASTSQLNALTLAGNLTVNNGNIYGPQYINMRYGASGGGGVRLYDNQGTIHSYWYGDGSGRGGLLDNNANWAVKVGIGTEPLILHCDNNPELYVYNSYVLAAGQMRAPIYYDSDDTGYYVNPNGTSNCSTIQSIEFQNAAGDGRGHRFWASDSYKIYMSSTGNGTWGGRVAGETTSDYNMYFRMMNGTNRGFVFRNNTTNVAGIDASGNGRFLGDVVAYSSSDARLKENLEVIPNALDKVSSLTGYTFDWNDKQTAYEAGKRDVGIVAQDVEAVLPEVVVDREETGYKAVNYEKLVPLLIEAIKELKAEVETLKKG